MIFPSIDCQAPSIDCQSACLNPLSRIFKEVSGKCCKRHVSSWLGCLAEPLDRRLPPPSPLKRPNPSAQYPQLGPIPTMKPLHTTETHNPSRDVPINEDLRDCLPPMAPPVFLETQWEPTPKISDACGDQGRKPATTAAAVGSFALPLGPKGFQHANGGVLPPPHPQISSPAVPKPTRVTEDSEMPQAEIAFDSFLLSAEAAGFPTFTDLTFPAAEAAHAGVPAAKSVSPVPETRDVTEPKTPAPDSVKFPEGDNLTRSPPERNRD